MSAASDSPLVHAPGVRLEQRSGTPTLVSPDGAKVHHVNATALAIWELCDGETTLDEMASAVVALFDGDATQLAADVANALDELTALGLLAPAPRRTKPVVSLSRQRVDLDGANVTTGGSA